MRWDDVDNAMMSLSYHGPRFNTLIERIVGKKGAHEDTERLYEE
ncbi:MAG: hypothetical protein V4820_15905 [Pseudomonadota bacterium]